MAGRTTSARTPHDGSLTNAGISAMLVEIADLLEIKGESAFKVGAYRRAAESVARSPLDVAAELRAGRPLELRGVGSSIAERLDELVTSGRIAYLDGLREDVPPTLRDLLAIPGVGPRTIGEVWRELGIATLGELEAAARAGRLREVRGLGARSEARILEGIAEAARGPRAADAASARHRRLAGRIVELAGGAARRALGDDLRLGAAGLRDRRRPRRARRDGAAGRRPGSAGRDPGAGAGSRRRASPWDTSGSACACVTALSWTS